MRRFEVGPLLPEFVSEHAPGEAAEVELAELFAELSVVAASAVSPSELAQGRARLLGAVSQSAERFAPLFEKLTKFFDLSAEALRAVFARSEQESEWQPGPLPWVSLLHLQGGPAIAGLDTGLVRLKKGMPFPRHRHLGNERVLILEGSYQDHEGRLYGPGDFHDMAQSTEHALQMSADEDVLLAVILSGEIEIVT
jgi:quercetin dioxygenase-like cupin family protein